MFCRLELEDLASNAFITLLRANKLNAQRFISYYDIDRYGHAVVEILKNQGFECRLLLDRNRTSWFLYYFDKYFEEDSQNDYLGLKLKEGITEEDLLRHFTGYLALDVLLAFRNEKAINVLLIA